MIALSLQSQLRGMHEHSVPLSLPSTAADVKTVTQRIYQAANVLQVFNILQTSYLILVALFIQCFSPGAKWRGQLAPVCRADRVSLDPGAGQPRHGAGGEAHRQHREHRPGQHGHEGDQDYAREIEISAYIVHLFEYLIINIFPFIY